MRVKKYGANTVRVATGNSGKIAFFKYIQSRAAAKLRL